MIDKRLISMPLASNTFRPGRRMPSEAVVKHSTLLIYSSIFPMFGNDNDAYRQCANSCPSADIDWSSTRGGQPTASLTRPTACPQQANATSTDAVPTETGFVGTSTRSAVTSVATGAAPHSFQSFYMSTILCFVAIAISAC